MNGKIAVEHDLTPIKDYLSGKGYNVECINLDNQQSSANLQNYDAIVVTGQNSDFLGMHHTSTKAAVINADGLTPEDIANEIETSKLNS